MSEARPRAAAIFAVLFLAIAGASAQEARGWLITGPFGASEAGGFAESLDADYLAGTSLSKSGEAGARPSTIAAEGDPAWRDAGPAGRADGVDFIAAFGQVEDSVAYAFTTFRSAAELESVMRIGSDDGVKVWLNDELVFGHHVNRALVSGQDAVLVRLKEGENRLLVKLSQGWGSWEFSLNFVDPEFERAAAAGIRPTSLAVCLDEGAARPGGLVSGVVMTEPAAIIGGSARIFLEDSSGKRLGSAVAPISGRFSLSVPPDAPEICLIRAEGSAGGGAAGLRAAPSRVIVGDPAFIARKSIASARTAASVLVPGRIAPRGPCPDPEATLRFLVSELEGSLPEGLKTRESTLLAVSDVYSVAYGAAPLGGLHRYAYRSALDGSVQPYSLYVPQGYDPGKRYGLVVALHGASGNDWDMAASIASAEPGDMLIAAPYGRGDLGWSASGERDAMDVLDLVSAFYSVDPDRVYLTGRSMGGFGTWRLGQLYSSRFAAIASFAGWTSTESLENLVNTPVLVVHGVDDYDVPIDDDRAAVAVLEKLGGNVRFDALLGVGHDAMGAWMEGSGPERLLSWLRLWKRGSWPDKAKARTDRALYGRHSWLAIEDLSKPLSIAALDAEILDSRHVIVETENVSAFSLDLRHPKLAAAGSILLLVDGVNLTADARSPRARFKLGAKGTFRPAPDPEPLESEARAPNLGGGIAALYSQALCIVYGTQKASRRAVNEDAALALAGRDRAGILSSGASLGYIPVIPDTEADSALIASRSLILVGGAEENSVLARIGPRLPVPMGKGDPVVLGRKFGKAGMIQVCPNPEAPGRLVCAFALPFAGDRVKGYAAGLSIALRSFGSKSGIGGFSTPDLAVVDAAKGTLWSGSFDREWKGLVELYSSEASP